ncbi:MAG: two-component system sensor histidine kinase CreC, partial [Gammaproteobacteria bacterium]|nr:two-component system sensor histidine kinase CreC [Gammaproteobacteria bacterium]
HRTLRGQYGARSSPETPGDTESTVMHVAAPVRDRAGQLIGVLSVAKANRMIEPFIVASQQQILRKGGWLLLLSALIGLAMTAWVARGIGRLNRYAQAVSAGEPVPPPPSRRDEIGDLGQALETMRRKLEGKEYVERYVQALTHEMKSPLAAIRGAAELLQEPLPEAERVRFARNVQVQGERLTEMIEQLLALAAVEHRGRLERREPVVLAALTDEVVESVAPRLAQKGLRVDHDIAGSLTVSGDRFLLRQAVRNLIDNAIDFSSPDGTIELAAHRSASEIEFSIGDRGPGVPDYARDRIFERFYSTPRADGARSSGLGLTFVREVVAQHGGSIELQPRAGGGTRAVLRLPGVD